MFPAFLARHSRFAAPHFFAVRAMQRAAFMSRNPRRSARASDFLELPAMLDFSQAGMFPVATSNYLPFECEDRQ